MGEMLNGWKELAWENLEIQLKTGKAIMEGDGGKLPGDFKPFLEVWLQAERNLLFLFHSDENKERFFVFL